MQQTLEGWSREGETRGLMALRGVDTLTAVTTLAELGDLTRFDSPRQLMAFVGLVPSEHSSGSRRQRGAITKTGNAHVRRVLVEAAPRYDDMVFSAYTSLFIDNLIEIHVLISQPTFTLTDGPPRRRVVRQWACRSG